MDMKSILLLNIVTLTALALGCAGTPFEGLGGGIGGAGGTTDGTVSGCEPGMFMQTGLTTQRDVIARCGQPTTKQSSSKGSTWIYDPNTDVSSGDVMRESCDKMTGVANTLCIANLPNKISMTVQFDARGVVTDYEATQSAR